MTVSAQTLAFEYTANGVTTTFPYQCRILFVEQLKVYVNGVIQVGGYTVFNVGNQNGGDVVFSVAPAAGATVLIRRISDRVRTTDFQQAPYFTQEELLDLDQDYQTMLLQEAAAEGDKSIKIPSEETVNTTLPSAAERAGKQITFGPSGEVQLTNTAAAIAGADLVFAPTKTAADSLAAGLGDGATVIVDRDETRNFERTRYTVASAALINPIDDTSFVQAGTGAVARTSQEKMREFVSVKDFGAVGDGVTNDSAAFKLAVAEVAIDGVLLIPATSSFYSIDTSGGLTDSVEINKAMEVRFEGEVKASFSAIQSNPPFIFNVTADDVSFTGTGKISGDGAVDSVNTGTDSTMPGLIRVSGDNFTITGVTIDTPPKVGISLFNCLGAKITNCTFTGGPTTYTDTAYFAIRAFLGGSHIISDNLFTPDSTGGMFVNAIFFNGTESCVIDSNVCIRPYEKLAYIVGSYNLVTNNYVTGNSNTIPGTSQAGTLTSVFRGMGDYNKFSNNYTKFCLAGCTIMDGLGNQVTENSFIECGQLGVAVFPSASYTGTFNNTVISDNVITGAGITGIVNTHGMLIDLNYASTENVYVVNNHITGFASSVSSGIIFAQIASPYSLTNCKISGNRINGGSIGVNGIYLGRVTDSLISDNYLENLSAFAFVENAGAYNSFFSNKCDSITSIGISGLDATSTGQQNQYTREPLVGLATLANAITTTVTHGGVAPNARVFLQTANDEAGVLIVSRGWPTTFVSSANFAIRMANGTASGTTTAQFFYNIVQ